MRRMLLCVTATSMAAIIDCKSAHPVGDVAPPFEGKIAQTPPDADVRVGRVASDVVDAGAATVGQVAAVPDASRVK
jgi:hypothetical protein